MDDRETAEVSPMVTSSWCVASCERQLRPRIQEYGLKGSIRADRRGWGRYALPEEMSAAGTRAARGPPRSNPTRTSSLERRTLLVDTLTVLKFPEASGTKGVRRSAE